MTNTGEIQKAAVFIERLTIRDFRGIRELDLRLQPGLTLLVGRNNAGKSRILRALHVAVGGTRAKRDDLTVGTNSEAEIDVVAAPLPSISPIEEGTPFSSKGTADKQEKFSRAVSQLFGSLISVVSEEPLRERLAWRTTITMASEDTGARSQSHIMNYSEQSGEWSMTESSAHLNREQRSLFVAELVDTQRDLDSELRNPGSSLRKIMNDLNVREGREELESRLTELGNDIVERSETLKELRTALETLDRYLDTLGNVRVNAVPNSLEELARTIGVSFGTGQEHLAARLQGSGVRSLASLQVQDLFYRLRLGSDGPDLRPHTTTLVEEPEAHLHPHAIFELPSLLENQGHQVVAATHSPQLAAVVDPKAIRLVRATPEGEHTVTDFGPVDEEDHRTPRAKRQRFYVSEMEKLKRMVERPFGDLLFARAIVIGDGATERAFLPPVLRNSLGPLAHGISVIDSDGMNPYLVTAVIKFAKHVEVPFLVFADNDCAGQKAVEKLIDTHLPQYRVVWSGSPENGGAIEQMMVEFDLDLCRRVYHNFDPKAHEKDQKEILSIMKKPKGSIGSLLAQEFVETYPYRETKTKQPWPAPLTKLVEKLDSLLKNEGEVV